MEANGKAIIVRTQQDPMFIMALEPTSFAEAFQLCKMAVASHLLPKTIQTPEAAMMILMRGRELGLTAMQAFSSIYVVDGKTSLGGELIVALIKRATDLCSYFSYISGDATQATFETKRVGDPTPTRFTFTWKMAENMRLTEKDNWKKQPENMLRWRCATALARLVYPELTIGIYQPDEVDDTEQAQASRGPNVIDADFEVQPQAVRRSASTKQSQEVKSEEASRADRPSKPFPMSPPPVQPSLPTQVTQMPPTAGVAQETAPPPKDEEPLADCMKRWQEALDKAVTVAEADKVRREVKKRVAEWEPEFNVMVGKYKAAVQRMRGGAPTADQQQ